MKQVTKERAIEVFGKRPFEKAEDEGLTLQALFFGGPPGEPILAADVVEVWSICRPLDPRAEPAVWCPDEDCWDLM